MTLGTLSPHTILMIRPTGFSVNAETAKDNHFQAAPDSDDTTRAVAEFDAMVAALRGAGVEVIVFDQASDQTPDAVFPNNWFTTHATGEIILYPMFAPSRRAERRTDIITALSKSFAVRDVIDLSGLEQEGQFLEGTGAMVFDHGAKTAFMARSSRASDDLLQTVCERIGYAPFAFDAMDQKGRPIYHTNVMMAVGEHTALVGLDCVSDVARRQELRNALTQADRVLIDLAPDQIAQFAGNMLEVQGERGPVLVMSAAAATSLSPDQHAALAKKAQLLAVPLPTIEKAGGSARCMMAGIHLPGPSEHGPSSAPSAF